MNSFSWKKMLWKGIKSFICFAVAILIDKFIIAYPEWAQLTVGGVLIMFINWLKIQWSIKFL